MSSAATVVADDVLKRARSLDRYVRKMESLHGRAALTRTDLNRTYSMAYMDYVTYLERSIERLFLGVVMGRLITSAPRSSPLVAIRSDAVARAVIRGDRRYVDWLPYTLTRKRADAFLAGGRPFDRVSKADEKFLDRLGVLRNAIAHDSNFSRKRFVAEFTSGLAVPPAQRQPAGYLQGQHAVGQTRLQYLVAEGYRVMVSMCT